MTLPTILPYALRYPCDNGESVEAAPIFQDVPALLPPVSFPLPLPSPSGLPPGSDDRLTTTVPLRARSLPHITYPTQRRSPWSRLRAARQAEADGDVFIAAAVRALGVESRTIAVVGAKGGVGTTTIALLAGSLLAEVPDARPVLVELTDDWGGIECLLGDTGGHTVTDLLAHLTAAHRVGLGFVQGFMTPWARLPMLLAPHDPTLAARLTTVDYGRTLHLLEAYYNLVLLDCGPSLTHPLTQFALGMADHVVLVADPDPVALGRTHRVVHYLTDPPHPFTIPSFTSHIGTRAHAPTNLTVVLNHTDAASLHVVDAPDWKEVMSHLNTLVPLPYSEPLHRHFAAGAFTAETLSPSIRRAMKTLLAATLGRLAYP